MTAVTPLVRIPSPWDIATSPLYTDGTWRDPATGLDLPQFLAHHLGPREARRLLDDASDIVDGRRAPARPVQSGVPRRGVDRVWSFDGVDHDPIPARQVTVCGLLIPPPFIYDYAGALPCPDCYDGETS